MVQNMVLISGTSIRLLEMQKVSGDLKGNKHDMEKVQVKEKNDEYKNNTAKGYIKLKTKKLTFEKETLS